MTTEKLLLTASEITAAFPTATAREAEASWALLENERPNLDEGTQLAVEQHIMAALTAFGIARVPKMRPEIAAHFGKQAGERADDVFDELQALPLTDGPWARIAWQRLGEKGGSLSPEQRTLLVNRIGAAWRRYVHPSGPPYLPAEENSPAAFRQAEIGALAATGSRSRAEETTPLTHVRKGDGAHGLHKALGGAIDRHPALVALRQGVGDAEARLAALEGENS